MATIDWWVALEDDGHIRYSSGSAQIVAEWITDAVSVEPELKIKRVKGRLTLKDYTVTFLQKGIGAPKQAAGRLLDGVLHDGV